MADSAAYLVLNVAELVIGREPERALLDAMLASKEAELVALYGRRRVGKTSTRSSLARDEAS